MRIKLGTRSLTARTVSQICFWSLTRRQLSFHKVAEPLRILYCGSDEFSTVTLEKLYTEHRTNPDLIASIDVVSKAPKPSGRGLKTLREVPIKHVAERLQLPLHEISTFTGWTPPLRNGLSINVVIAVSFGLLVPPRILSLARYGGLNLHPSLLPELRGPAPLQHTLMNGLSETGVTLQTLHPKHFDQGVILAQEKFQLPIHATQSLENLRDYAAEKAANVLIQSLRRHIFLPPLKQADNLLERPVTNAPKITPEHSHLAWDTWGADRILRTQSAIGPLWNRWIYPEESHRGQVIRSLRVIWHDLQVVPDTEGPGSFVTAPGFPSVYSKKATDNSGATPQTATRMGGMWTCDGSFVTPGAITIEGRKKGWPGNSAQSMEYLLSLAGIATDDQATLRGRQHRPYLN